MKKIILNFKIKHFILIYLIVRNNLKATTLMATENPSALVEELGAQALISGQVLNSRDYEIAVDSVSAQDVSSLALKIIKGKGAMASVGKLYNTPYLEDLL
jgi:predicted Zn-dependent peptidase